MPEVVFRLPCRGGSSDERPQMRSRRMPGRPAPGRLPGRPAPAPRSSSARPAPKPSPMTGRVTMKDIAAALGVSTATVSRALRGDLAISAATRQAVQEMTERVQYRPSAAARRLRTKSSSLVGVVVQSVGDGYIGDVVLGIQSRARDLGYQPLFFASEGREDLEAEALEVFLSEQVTEFIAVSPTGGPTMLQRAVQEGLHVAVINGDTEVPGAFFDEASSSQVSQRVSEFAAQAGD